MWAGRERAHFDLERLLPVVKHAVLVLCPPTDALDRACRLRAKFLRRVLAAFALTAFAVVAAVGLLAARRFGLRFLGCRFLFFADLKRQHLGFLVLRLRIEAERL